MRSWFVSQKLFLSVNLGTHTAVHTCSGQSNWSNSHSFTTLILLCAIFASCSVCMKISALILLLVNIYHDVVVLVLISPSEISSNWMYRDNGVAAAAVAMTVPCIFGLFFIWPISQSTNCSSQILALPFCCLAPLLQSSKLNTYNVVFQICRNISYCSCRSALLCFLVCSMIMQHKV